MFSRIFQSPPFAPWVKSHPVLANLYLGLLYWGFANIGFQLADIHSNVTPIWPPSGLAIAAMLIGGCRLLPGLFGGALLVNALTGISPLSALAIACGNTLEAAVALGILHRIRPHKDTLSEFALPLWVLSASLVAPTTSALVGSLSICFLDGPSNPEAFLGILTTWWSGNAIGILIVSPTILTLKRLKLNVIWLIKATILTILSIICFNLVFLVTAGSPLLFFSLLLLLLACKWFGPTGCALTAVALVSFLAIATVYGYAPFQGSNTNDRILLLNIFLFSLGITSLVIPALFKIGSFVVPSILFAIGWSVSGLLFYSLRSISTEIDERNFKDLVRGAESAVQTRLNTYIDTLIAAAGFYINSGYVTRDEWSGFVRHLNLSERYPGINGIGFINAFKPEELEAYVKQVRESEVPDFTIKPVPGVEIAPPDELGYQHYIITYIEPLEINRAALGLNTASEQNRQDAGARARDTGLPSMTDRIILVQDGKERPGFLIYYPMYKTGMPRSTVTERRAAFVGWSYAPFVTELFLEGVLGNRTDQIDFAVFDSDNISPQDFVFMTKGQSHEDIDKPRSYQQVTTLDLAGQLFTFGWNRGSTFKTHSGAAAAIAAASLALGTCFLVGIVVNLQSTNRRANKIVDAKTTELRKTNQQLQLEVLERQRAESESEAAKIAAESANMAKSEFLAMMSHEIRTPMNSVLGFAELLSESDLSSEQRVWANYIQGSGNSLLHIINDILDFSKIEAGKLILEQISYNPVECTEEVVATFSAMAAQRNLVIDTNLSDRIPEQVLGDPIRFKQVITNLIANALKFTDRGGIHISFTWSGNHEKGNAEIHVSDTGIGIPADKLDRLFSEFSQLDSSTTRKFGGTGLGLAICKKIVGLMGGKIWAESTIGKGTLIAFEIPMIAVEQTIRPLTHEENSIKPLRSPSTSALGFHVLLVDDNAVNKKLGQTILRQLGCQTTLASNGLEALEYVKKVDFDIIFMDCQMPVMDGYEATRAIRQLESENALPRKTNSPIPIIALTANTLAEDQGKCLNSGMDGYMRKPCRIENFRTILEDHLLQDLREKA